MFLPAHRAVTAALRPVLDAGLALSRLRQTSAKYTVCEPINTVAIQNFAFSPAAVTVKAGTTVTWTNQDQDPHTVSAMSGAFGSPALNTGQSYHYTFTTPGTFQYLCTIHPFMTQPGQHALAIRDRRLA